MRGNHPPVMFIDWSKLCCLILQRIYLHKSGCNLNTVKEINKFQKLRINGIIISNIYLYMYSYYVCTDIQRKKETTPIHQTSVQLYLFNWFKSNGLG